MSKKETIRTAVFLLLALALVLCACLVFDRKTACRYTEKINGALKELKADGTIRKIIDKYIK